MLHVDWRRTAAITVTVSGILLLLYLIGRYAVGLILPFLLAFVLSFLTRPVVLWLSRHYRVPEKVLAVAVTLLSLCLIFGLCYLLCARLLIEAQNLLLSLAQDSADPEGKIAQIGARLGEFFSRIPLISQLRDSDFLSHFMEDEDGFLRQQLQSLITEISSRVTAFLGSFLGALPGFLLFLLITVISCFYFSVEHEKVTDALTRLLPDALTKRLPRWRERTKLAIKRYIRAYFLLFLLTFAQLLIGFLLLRVRYLFLLALLTALLDALPVLGVGAVLLPYSLFCFLTGDIVRGVGLLVLYILITVVRQIAESHLVGKSLGLHPILMLISFYVGLRLFGVVGVFLGPALALLGKAFLQKNGETV